MSTRHNPSTHACDADEASARGRVFVTTRWSVVLAAGRGESPGSRAALESLCQTYWYPLYAFARRRGHSPEDAQDLTQDFFARLLEKNWLDRACPERGRFRSFVLGAFEHFLANEWRKGRTLKRGGGIQFVPMACEEGETHYCQEPSDPATPEKLFERRWALMLLDRVLERLDAEQTQAGKAAQFALMKPCIAGGRDIAPLAELGTRLGMSEGAVKVAVHRLRQRYRQLLLEEVAQTVASPGDVEAELRHLIQAIAGE